jgi:hypothetical protein
MRDEALDLDALLHPARAYAYPKDVIQDPDLTLYEKRAILASWASDACAVEAVPALRQMSDGTPPVRFEEVMEALQSLDRPSTEPAARPKAYFRRWRNRSAQRGENRGAA